MPYTQDHLPFSGRNAVTRHTSYLAARDAAKTRETKRERYRVWLRAHGPASDQAAAEALQLPLSTICSVRNALVDLGVVSVADMVLGRYGKKVARWRVREVR